MRKKLLLAVLLIFVYIGSALANWVQTGGPEGGYAQSLLRVTNGDLIAAANTGGIYKSTDNGSNWIPSNSGLITESQNFSKILAIRKGLNGKLYIHASFGTTERAFVSADNGNSWTMLTAQVWGAGTTSATPDGTLYQWVNNELAKSANNGTSWTFPILNGLPKEKISDFIPISNTELYIVLPDAKGIYKSTDGGNSWNKLTTQPLSLLNCQLFYNDGILYCLSGTTIQISKDNGQSWAYTYNPPTFPLEPIAWAAADNGDIYVSGRIAGILKSTDKGNTWNTFSTGLDITGLNLTIATTKSNEVIVCQYGFGLFKSPQSSAAFSVSHSGFKSSTIFHFYEGKSGTLYTATDGSAYSSTNGGSTWKRLIDFGLNHSSICENGNSIFIGKNDGVMRSTNGGSTWAYVKNGFSIGTQQYVHQLLVTPKGTILAATGGGLFRTINNGDNWTKLTFFGNNTKIRSIIQKSNDELFVSANRLLYKSVDDGVNWVNIPLGKLDNPAVNLDGQVDVVDYTSDSKNNLYINFESNFYAKSTDGGINWKRTNITTSGLIGNIKTLLFGQKDSLFVVINNNVLVSTDFGVTHQELNKGLIARDLKGLAKTANGQLFLLTSGSGLMKNGVVKTTTPNIVLNHRASEISNISPNPFQSETQIEFQIHDFTRVTLKVYNITGTEVVTLVDDYRQPGNYSVPLNTSKIQMKGGVYFCKLSSMGQNVIRKMIFAPY